MSKKERFTVKQSTSMGQIPRSTERISSYFKTPKLVTAAPVTAIAKGYFTLFAITGCAVAQALC